MSFCASIAQTIRAILFASAMAASITDPIPGTACSLRAMSLIFASAAQDATAAQLRLTAAGESRIADTKGVFTPSDCRNIQRSASSPVKGDLVALHRFASSLLTFAAEMRRTEAKILLLQLGSSGSIGPLKIGLLNASALALLPPTPPRKIFGKWHSKVIG